VDAVTPDQILMELAQRSITAIDREIREVTAELAACQRRLVQLSERREQVAKRYASIRGSHLEF
jgi:hypothetical protein